MMNAAQPLIALKATKPFFVGIDSDGCVFDSMGIKQRECFCPMMIGYFGLQPVAQAARECKEFADLFSKTRGANRLKTTVRILHELLPGHPMVIERGFNVPDFGYYAEWVENPASLLSDKGLQQAIDTAANAEAKRQLECALIWSQRVNAMVEEIVRDIPPIPYVRESLQRLAQSADIIVCSQTPTKAIVREWQEHDIARYPAVIAGQEMGTKSEHLKLATQGKYAPQHVLMIGDAPGDYTAACENDSLFYPIIPGHETASWKRFYDEAFDRFIGGRLAGDYQTALIAEFDSYLPNDPPWKQ
jgi:phosphoglycolate phosphatase-like HAD superfamily hydrolase